MCGGGEREDATKPSLKYVLTEVSMSSSISTFSRSNSNSFSISSIVCSFVTSTFKTFTGATGDGGVGRAEAGGTKAEAGVGMVAGRACIGCTKKGEQINKSKNYYKAIRDLDYVLAMAVQRKKWKSKCKKNIP